MISIPGEMDVPNQGSCPYQELNMVVSADPFGTLVAQLRSDGDAFVSCAAARD